jgi:hypothetical protein
LLDYHLLYTGASMTDLMLACARADDALQLKILSRIIDTMHDGAALVIGIHENLPEGADRLSMWIDKQRIYQRSGGKVEDMRE